MAPGPPVVTDGPQQWSVIRIYTWDKLAQNDEAHIAPRSPCWPGHCGEVNNAESRGPWYTEHRAFLHDVCDSLRIYDDSESKIRNGNEIGTAPFWKFTIFDFKMNSSHCKT